MGAPRPRLVVRNHAPGRRVLWVVVALVIMVAASLGAFEFGRSRAGFDGAAEQEICRDILLAGSGYS